MREKKLSRRLQAVVDLVTPGMCVADVGCDHAYVSIYLVEHGIAPKCLAIDVRTGPLERARKNIAAHGLSDYITVHLGSGLDSVHPGQISSVLMAGMGGILVRDLLEESRELSKSLKEWILQPQSDVCLVRAYIRESNFRIAEENMVYEDGKFYPMFRAVPIERISTENAMTWAKEWQAVYDRFGEQLLKEQHPILKEYLKQREWHYRHVLSNMPQEESERILVSRKELTQELAYVRQALSLWDTMPCA